MRCPPSTASCARKGQAAREAWQARLAVSHRRQGPVRDVPRRAGRPGLVRGPARLRGRHQAGHPQGDQQVPGGHRRGPSPACSPVPATSRATPASTSVAPPSIQSHAHPGGTQVHYGIREHAMAAAMNGMALHGGVLPVGGTFFVFSDYARPSVRLAAISKAHVVYFFTHDSVGLGEDGPTHQPIEQLASLRAMPGLRVIRPADANETAAAWRIAVDCDGPTALVLSRQDLPVLEGTAALAGRGRRPRGLRARARTRGPSGSRHRPHRHRERGPALRGGRRTARRRGRARPGRVLPELGPVRRPGSRLSRSGPPSRRPASRRRGGRLVRAGSATPTRPSASTASGLRRQAR